MRCPLFSRGRDLMKLLRRLIECTPLIGAGETCSLEWSDSPKGAPLRNDDRDAHWTRTAECSLQMRSYASFRASL